MDNAYPKTYRLCKKQQFDNVFNGKCRIHFGCVSVVFIQNQQNHPRLGLLVSKKILPLAAQRNLFKRVIREEFRKNSHQLKTMDFVIIANRNLTGQTSEQIKVCLRKSLPKLILQFKG